MPLNPLAPVAGPAFRRILVTALVAGAAAGIAVSAVQALHVWPLILAAEVYEEAAHAVGAGADIGHEAEAWSPADGLPRIGFTVLFNVLAGVGFALMLNAVLTLRRAAGHAIDAGRGVVWGAAGFAVFALAPSLGLPPEVPGLASADLALRQAWWIATVIASGAGIAGMVFGGNLVWRILGALLLIAPHVVGAPHPLLEAGHEGAAVPAELAARFAGATLAATALFWLVLGGVSGWLQRRLG